MPRSLLERLKSRKLFHWVLAYLAGAWLLLQVLALLSEPFGWPPLVLRAATALAGAGLFAVLVLAWYHGERGAQRVSGMELLMLTGILVTAAAAVSFVDGDEGGSAGAPTKVPAAGAGAEQGSIAVLPFADMSDGPGQEYFADGLTDELLNVLSQLPELRVISRTSSFAYRDAEVPLDSIARALRVAHVLEGSVRRTGTRVRVTAQLIDAGSGYHVWSRNYDRELRDIFGVQDEIAHAIVAALELRLGARHATAPLARTETGDPEAHALLLRGLQQTRPYSREGTARAVELFRAAIGRDPRYARPYAALAQVYGYQAYLKWGPRAKLMREASQLARQALALDPALPEAHFVEGFIAHHHAWDFRRAEASYRRALELKPGDARVHSLLGTLLMQLGRSDEAVAEARRASELDPLHPGMIGNLGAVLMGGGRCAEAIEAFRSVLALAPGHPATLSNLAGCYFEIGLGDDAVRTAEDAVDREPQAQYTLASLAYLYGRTGRHEDARRVLATLQALPDASPYALAAAHAGLGAREPMLVLLERSLREKDPWALMAAVDPVFESYREEPRVRRMLRRAGLG